MSAKKKQVMNVVDMFFALKSGVSKLKKEILTDLEGNCLYICIQEMKLANLKFIHLFF